MEKIKKYIHVYFFFFTAKEKKRFLLLMAVATAMALLDIAGIASLLPFLQLVARPQSVHENELLNFVWRLMGSPGQTRFLFLTGLAVFLFLVGGSIFKALGTYAMLRFSNSMRYHIGGRMFRGYLNQPYDFFLNRNSSDLVKNVMQEVDQIVGSLYVPSMTLVANGTMALAILTLLLVFDWLLALITGAVLGGAFVGLFLITKRRIRNLGKERAGTNKLRSKVATEAFGGVKEVKLKNYENIFTDLFNTYSQKFSDSVALSQILGQVPKFILEAIAFGGILLIVLYLILTHEDLHEILPTIGFFAFAGYKLMPSLQAVLNSGTMMRFMLPTLKALYDDYRQMSESLRAKPTAGGKLEFKSDIQLKKIFVRYPQTDKDALANVSLQIRRREITGIIGTSGAGKTTMVDVILGLLPVRSGAISIDGKTLAPEDMAAWQRNIGYVPQHIFLTDDTVAANIAFTLRHEDANLSAVERAAKAAQIHDFIVNELPQGYATVIGERGVRLSGGQRQRIGIARALYTDPEVLVLDEATSALDEPTERAVLKAVSGLRREKTIIMITHRTSTLKVCDKIYRLEKGKLVKG